MELLIVIRGTVDLSIAYERFISNFDNSNSWYYEKFSIGEETVVKIIYWNPLMKLNKQ